ncbi:substrate-binding periplasmic protein [Undibacterium sp. Ji67W]|uniref:substrate-binding periplasmic protein n=1 Tax=Undibacterium sp. Ji67W TaxID=3413042 RepID=UPI003BF014BC
MRLLTAMLAVCLSTSAFAHCSRPINVPMAVTGFSVIDQGEIISGIYPEFLRSLSAKEGCTFLISLVPRARMELMFENGQADLLVAATRTPRRDKLGIFFPFIRSRPVLISLPAFNRQPVKSFQELLNQSKTKVAVVRGFDYGERYQALLVDLQKQDRLVLDVDPLSVARLLKLGTVDYALMAPSILAGTAQTDSRVADMVDQLRYEALAELPWGESGVYVSKKSLNPEDYAAIQEMFENAERNNVIWKGFQRYYKEEILREGVRPL